MRLLLHTAAAALLPLQLLSAIALLLASAPLRCLAAALLPMQLLPATALLLLLPAYALRCLLMLLPGSAAALLLPLLRTPPE